MSDDLKFDWNTDNSVVLQHQPAIAVYANPAGQVVIRAEREWTDEDDTFLVVGSEHLVAVIYAMLDAANLPIQLTQATGAGWIDIDRPPTTRTERMMAARPDIDWDAATKEFDTKIGAEFDEPENAEKRPMNERRAHAKGLLVADPERSNRSIAAECGVSDKTVATIRAELDAETRTLDAENLHPTHHDEHQQQENRETEGNPLLLDAAE